MDSPDNRAALVKKVARKDVALEFRDMLLQQMGINPKDAPYEEDPNSPHAGDPNWIDMSSYLNYQKKDEGNGQS